MAEDDLTPEQLAAIAAENEEPELVNYRAPAQKSVKEIHELDKDDESLRKYKEALLGPGISETGKAHPVLYVCSLTVLLLNYKFKFKINKCNQLVWSFFIA